MKKGIRRLTTNPDTCCNVTENVTFAEEGRKYELDS